MKRPPFRRHKRSRSTARSRWNPAFTRGLRNLLLLVVAASVLQWLTQGEVSWPGQLLDRTQEYISRPEAGWHQAKDALEKQGAAREGQPLPKFDLRGRVVRVADGDTVSLLDEHGEQHKIRFYGIDTPELQQSFGREASAALSRMVYRREVGVVVVDIDDYQRKVGTVYVDGIDVNLALVAQGYAWWYRYHAPHERALQNAEQTARREQRGLWANARAVAPWNWRRSHRGR